MPLETFKKITYSVLKKLAAAKGNVVKEVESKILWMISCLKPRNFGVQMWWLTEQRQHLRTLRDLVTRGFGFVTFAEDGVADRVS
ncbi:hypothetical protein HanPSC8_Chr17g0778851 [Helianthus annuus]|nr:hypothetical protein HanPSC8_Chr17g0778851 [Helianthus annuus]